VIADIRARDQAGRQFNLEMQAEVPWYFRNRLLFYWSKFHAQQMWKGEKYQTLRPTIQVCFTKKNVFPDVAEHHLVFQVIEAKSGLLLAGDLEIHLIELPKFTKSVDELSSDLDRWCYFFRHGADLDLDCLPPSLDVPPIRRALEVLTVFTQDEREREAYEASLKFQRDQSSLLAEAAEAEERGTKKGMEKGREQGALIGEIRLSQQLLKMPQSAEAELAQMSMEDLMALRAQLLKQLMPESA
jgi:predicted transposase/invertase (TIGR01784 family)